MIYDTPAFSSEPPPFGFRAGEAGNVGNKSVERTAPQESSVGIAGAFFTKYTNTDGDIYLQGGTLSGGTGNEPVSDILIYDHITGWTGSPDDHLVLSFDGTGVVEDGVLLSGFDVTSVSGPSPGAVGSTTLPTASSAAGSGDISLGIFSGDTDTTGFGPANVGNIQITFCPGSFTITRA